MQPWQYGQCVAESASVYCPGKCRLTRRRTLGVLVFMDCNEREIKCIYLPGMRIYFLIALLCFWLLHIKSEIPIFLLSCAEASARAANHHYDQYSCALA
jgi:hypothetical protein